MTLIERVARAIDAALTCRECGAYCGEGAPPKDCDGRCNLDGPTPEHRARAAIEAMREPTEAMIGAPEGNTCIACEVWQAMIDAAKAEPGAEQT